MNLSDSGERRRRALREAGPELLCAALTGVQYGATLLLSLLLVVIGEDQLFTRFEVSGAMALTLVANTIGMNAVPRLAARWESPWLAAICTWLSAIPLYLISVAWSLPSLYVAGALLGLLNLGPQFVAARFLGDWDNDARPGTPDAEAAGTLREGIYTAVWALGIAGAQTAAGIVAASGWRWAPAAHAMTAAVIGVLFVLLVPAGGRVPRRTHRLRPTQRLRLMALTSACQQAYLVTFDTSLLFLLAAAGKGLESIVFIGSRYIVGAIACPVASRLFTTRGRAVLLATTPAVLSWPLVWLGLTGGGAQVSFLALLWVAGSIAEVTTSITTTVAPLRHGEHDPAAVTSYIGKGRNIGAVTGMAVQLGTVWFVERQIDASDNDVARALAVVGTIVGIVAAVCSLAAACTLPRRVVTRPLGARVLGFTTAYGWASLGFAAPLLPRIASDLGLSTAQALLLLGAPLTTATAMVCGFVRSRSRMPSRTWLVLASLTGLASAGAWFATSFWWLWASLAVTGVAAVLPHLVQRAVRRVTHRTEGSSETLNMAIQADTERGNHTIALLGGAVAAAVSWWLGDSDVGWRAAYGVLFVASLAVTMVWALWGSLPPAEPRTRQLRTLRVELRTPSARRALLSGFGFQGAFTLLYAPLSTVLLLRSGLGVGGSQVAGSMIGSVGVLVAWVPAFVTQRLASATPRPALARRAFLVAMGVIGVMGTLVSVLEGTALLVALAIGIGITQASLVTSYVLFKTKTDASGTPGVVAMIPVAARLLGSLVAVYVVAALLGLSGVLGRALPGPIVGSVTVQQAALAGIMLSSAVFVLLALVGTVHETLRPSSATLEGDTGDPLQLVSLPRDDGKLVVVASNSRGDAAAWMCHASRTNFDGAGVTRWLEVTVSGTAMRLARLVVRESPAEASIHSEFITTSGWWDIPGPHGAVWIELHWDSRGIRRTIDPGSQLLPEEIVELRRTGWTGPIPSTVVRTTLTGAPLNGRGWSLVGQVTEGLVEGAPCHRPGRHSSDEAPSAGSVGQSEEYVGRHRRLDPVT